MPLHDSGTVIQTPRLILRPWRDADLKPFAALNADPDVMRHFPATLTRDESNRTAEFFRARFQQNGWGLWAVELPGVAGFLGFTGLHAVSDKMPFAPAVEVGWRLAARWWNHGYATEAARAAIAFGFGTLGLNEIVSFTIPANTTSRRVMEKLGMTHDPADNFDHPGVPEGDPTRPHVLYRLARP
jgi:RimJ/RimL family protein N-acetyltransferase